MTIAISLHILAAIVWIGGMFFAVMVLRPAAGELEPKDRLPLWGRTFKKFLPWVWMAILILLITGYWMVFRRVEWIFKFAHAYSHYAWSWLVDGFDLSASLVRALSTIQTSSRR